MRPYNIDIWRARRGAISISIVVGTLIGYVLFALGFAVYFALALIEALGPGAITSEEMGAIAAFVRSYRHLVDRSEATSTNGLAVESTND